MSNSKAPQFPLSGGDYIQNDTGLKQVTKPTAPPVPKSVAQAAKAVGQAPSAEPEKPSTKPDKSV